MKNENIDVEQIDKQLMEDVEKFKNVYGPYISSYAKKINSQFRAITPYGYITKTDIILIKSGTRMELKIEKGIEKDSYNYILYIGYKEIMMMMDSVEGLDLFEAFCKIVSHEYLHILCGHFDPTVVNGIHNFALGNEDIHLDNVLGCKIFLLERDERSASLNLKYDGKILNIAGDFEINNLLNIREPFLRSSNFGLPEGLSTVEYYSIVYHLLNSFPDNEIKSKDFCSTGTNSFLSDYYANSKTSIRELFDSMKDDTHFNATSDGEAFFDWRRQGKYDSFVNDKKFSNLQGNLPAYATKLNISQTGIWKEFNDLLKAIIKAEHNMKLGLVDKYDSWHKFNNRKDSSLMYPGKCEKIGAMEKKLAPKSVLFVDISASMQSVIAPLFTFCYFVLSKTNVELVFYDTQIQYIYTNSNNIELEPFTCGGTNAYNSVKEYERRFQKPKNIFILSDCEDNTLEKILKEFNSKIWKINNSKISQYKGGY